MTPSTSRRWLQSAAETAEEAEIGGTEEVEAVPDVAATKTKTVRAELRADPRVPRPGRDTPPCPQRPAVTATTSTERTLGTVWNLTVVLGRIVVLQNNEMLTNLEKKKFVTSFRALIQ